LLGKLISAAQIAAQAACVNLAKGTPASAPTHQRPKFAFQELSLFVRLEPKRF
jgi:hypothetical protein